MLLQDVSTSKGILSMALKKLLFLGILSTVFQDAISI